MYRQSRKTAKQRYLPPRVPTVWRTSAHYWLRSVGEFGAPQQISRVSRLAFVTAATSLTGGQPIFARCMAVSWAGTLYMHFRGLLPPDSISPRAKFTLRPSLAFSYIGSVTARHASSGISETLQRGISLSNGIMELSQRAPPIFGWVAITLDIG